MVACEYSGRVRDAFIAKGHDAWSADLLPSESDVGHHYTGNALDLLERWQSWDLLIAHPPCTYLTNAGARWFKHPDIPKDQPPRRDMPHPDYPDRWDKRDEAIEFFKALQDCYVGMKCIENSQMSLYGQAVVGKMTQRVQPWMFGENFTKGACLWLDGLPPLVPTHTLSDYRKPPKAACHMESPGPDRWKRRSTTYKSIAAAMAEQWG